MRKALVVVDFQNDFISGALGFPEAHLIRHPILKKIEKALDTGVDLILTMDTHGSDYLQTAEDKALPIPHCIKNTWGWELDNAILPYKPYATVIEKSSYGSIELGQLLKEKDYDVVELCGLVTSICVLHNAIIAKTALPDATVIVDPDATEDPNGKLSALSCLKASMVI